MKYKIPLVTAPNSISATVVTAQQSLVQGISAGGCKPCTDSFSLAALARSRDVTSYRSIVARVPPNPAGTTDIELNGLLHMAAVVRTHDEDLGTLYFSERERFDTMHKPAYDVLRESMRSLAARARTNLDVVDEYHRWSSDVDARAKCNLKSDVEKGFAMMDDLSLIDITLQDLAREGKDSDAFHMLDALATRNNEGAIGALASVIQGDPAYYPQGAMPVEDLKLTMGVQRALKELARRDDSDSKLSLSGSAYESSNEDRERLLSNLAFDTAATLAEAEELIASDEIYYVRAFAHMLAIHDDSELVEAAANALLRTSLEEGSITSTFLLSIMAGQSEYAGDLLGRLGVKHLLAAIDRYRTHAIQYLRNLCSMPTVCEALSTMPVEEDERDLSYLSALAMHGDNPAAKKRLSELNKPTSAQIIPFKV